MSGNIHLEKSGIRIAASANLETWSSCKWEQGIQIDRLNDLDTLIVKTQNSTYEITIISGRDGDILVRGGEFFRQKTPGRLSGATLGSAFVKLRGIYVGFRMEIIHAGGCIITSPVNSIAMAL
jgi:hypothetical protein